MLRKASRRANMVRITGFKFVIAATMVLSLSTFSISPGVSASDNSRSQPVKVGRQIQPDCQSQSPQSAAFIADAPYIHGNAVLWEPPVDIECRDLFYGPGGP